MPNQRSHAGKRANYTYYPEKVRPKTTKTIAHTIIGETEITKKVHFEYTRTSYYSCYEVTIYNQADNSTTTEIFFCQDASSEFFRNTVDRFDFANA